MLSGLEDVVRASSVPRGSKDKFRWYDYAILPNPSLSSDHSLCKDVDAKFVPPIKIWPETVCHLSNLFLLDNESPPQLASTAIKQSNIASRFWFLQDTSKIRERYTQSLL